MRNPDLPPTQFLRDKLVASETLSYFKNIVTGPDTLINAGIIKAPSRICLSLLLSRGKLAPFNTLALEIENLSFGSVLVGINLKQDPEPTIGTTSGNVMLSGGREIVAEFTKTQLLFPLESFGFYGESVHWREMPHVEIFVCRDKDLADSGPLTVRLFSLHGLSFERPNGPRLQPKGLKTLLKWDLKELTRLTGNQDATHLFYPDSGKTDRIMPFSASDNSFRVQPPHPYPADSSEAVLSGTIMGQSIEGRIDWKYNPLGAHEWTHFLNRHHFLRPVAMELSASGCPRCREFLEDTLEDWIRLNPAPLNSNGGAGPSWETLTVAWRLREWFWVIGLTWGNSNISARIRSLMLASIWEHAQSLMDHSGHPNNWIIVESSALAQAGLLFPQLKSSEQWFDTGSGRIYEHVRKQFFEDGAHFEVSPLYHSICLNALLEFRSTARFCGFDVPEEFDSRLIKAGRYLDSLRRPDGSWPSINDSGSCNGDHSAVLDRIRAIFGTNALPRRDFDHLTKDQEPDFDHYPDSGIVVMRSSKERNSNFLIFRAGPAGAAHVHGDNLSVDASFGGHSGLIDPGISAYAPGPATEYYRSARSHNVALVDDATPPRASLPYKIRINPGDGSLIVEQKGDLIIATGASRVSDSRMLENIHMTRSIFFVRGQFWIVRDLFCGSGNHKISSCWKCYPSEVELIPESCSAHVTNAMGLDFMLAPIGAPLGMKCSVAIGENSPHRGWASIDGKDVHAPSIEFVQHVELPVTFYWGLFPRNGNGNFPERATLERHHDGAVSIEVEFSDWSRLRMNIGNVERPMPWDGLINLTDVVSLPDTRINEKQPEVH